MNRLLALVLASAACNTYNVADVIESDDSSLELGRIGNGPGIRCHRNSDRMPQRGIIRLGQDNAAVGTLACKALGVDDQVVTRIVLQGCVSPVGSPTDDDCTDAEESVVPDGVVNLVHLSFPNSAGGRSSESRIMTGGVVEFDSLDAFYGAGGGPGLFGPTGTTDVTVDLDSFTGNSGQLVQFNIVEIDTASGLSVPRNYRLRQFLAADAELSLFPSSYTPYGLTAAGPNTNVFEFMASSADSGDAEITQVTFALDAFDGSGSGWNACTAPTNFANPLNWSLTNEDGEIIDGDWAIIPGSGGACAFAQFTPIEHTLVVYAGQVKAFQVWADTSEAGETDSLNVQIPHESVTEAEGLESLVWGDGLDPNLSAIYVSELPVLGDTLTFIGEATPL